MEKGDLNVQTEGRVEGEMVWIKAFLGLLPKRLQLVKYSLSIQGDSFLVVHRHLSVNEISFLAWIGHRLFALIGINYVQPWYQSGQGKACALNARERERGFRLGKGLDLDPLGQEEVENGEAEELCSFYQSELQLLKSVNIYGTRE